MLDAIITSLAHLMDVFAIKSHFIAIRSISGKHLEIIIRINKRVHTLNFEWIVRAHFSRHNMQQVVSPCLVITDQAKTKKKRWNMRRWKMKHVSNGNSLNWRHVQTRFGDLFSLSFNLWIGWGCFSDCCTFMTLMTHKEVWR